MNLYELLKPEHRAAGLHLEDDEDYVYLYTDNEGLAIWNIHVTDVVILDTADCYLEATQQQKYSWRMKVK